MALTCFHLCVGVLVLVLVLGFLSNGRRTAASMIDRAR